MDTPPTGRPDPRQEAPRMPGKNIIPAATRAAVEWLLRVPGGLSEHERAQVTATIAAKTSESLQALNGVLCAKLRATVRTAAMDWAEANSADWGAMAEDASAVLEQALSERADPAVLLLHLEAYHARSFRAAPDIKRESAGFANAYSTTPPADRAWMADGMIGPTLQDMRANIGAVFRALHNGETAEALALLKKATEAPLSNDVVYTLRTPRTLYERLAMERTVARLQQVRTAQWTEAMRNERTGTADETTLVAALQHDPQTFVRRLMDALQTIERPELVTPYFRKRVAIGLPLYDLPLAIMKRLSPAHRAMLRDACNGCPGTAEEKTICRQIADSIDAYDNTPPSVAFTPNAMTLLNAVFRQERQQGIVEDKKPKDCTVMIGKRDFSIAEAAMDGCGFIPDSFYRASDGSLAKAFERDLPFAPAADFHAFLVSRLESAVPYDDQKRLLNARAQLLDALMCGPHVTQPNGSITIDTNGVYLTLETERRGKARGAALAAHLPYRYVSDEACANLLRTGRMSAANEREIRYNRARENDDTEMLHVLDREKAADIVKALGDHTDDPEAHIMALLADPAQHERLIRAAQPNRTVIHMPVSPVVRLLRDRNTKQPMTARLTALLRLAARMEAGIGTFDPQDPRYYELHQGIVAPLLSHLPQSAWGMLWRAEEGGRERIRLGINAEDGTAVSVLLHKQRLSSADEEQLGRLPLKH